MTGASKGIGTAIAEKLAEEGAATVVNYATSDSDAQNVVSRITARGGREQAGQIFNRCSIPPSKNSAKSTY